jgi:hypothetical protein
MDPQWGGFAIELHLEKHVGTTDEGINKITSLFAILGGLL